MQRRELPGNLIRFGVFEADLLTGELRKQGLKIKIREQPFQILSLLLEHPGEVLTREELQRRLWPADTFVDFDRGLNRAVNQLRDALGDSPESPRFIETLPKRGYRFIAPVLASLDGQKGTFPLCLYASTCLTLADRRDISRRTRWPK